MSEKLKWPTTEEVAAELFVHRKFMDKHHDYTDVRLQVYGPEHIRESWLVDGEGYRHLRWATHVGCSDYDTDHRGYWGASSIRQDDTLESLLSTAEELLDQAKDHAAQNGVEVGDE